MSDTDAQPSARSDRWLRLVLLGLWLVLSLWLASRHVLWRDEVRALSIALTGDSLVDMMRALHGEGHPFLWYVLLRCGWWLTGAREVLPVMAWLVGAGAMALLAWRAPFRPLTLVLVMFGGFGLYEYAVSARNYGLSMLVLFGIAALYRRWRERGVVIGLLLALLCNTNVPANFLAAGLVLFRLVEVIGEHGWRWTRAHSLWAANAAIAALGALLCFLQVFPPVHDAAMTPHPDGIGVGTVLDALISPFAFADLVPLLGPSLGSGLIVMLLVIGALIGLLRAPAAFVAGLAGVLMLQLFFGLVYPGAYRHEALLLAYFVTLYWLVADGAGGRWPQFDRAARIGGAAFTILLALQLPASLLLVAGAIPQSRAADLGQLIADRDLEQAIIIADPDVMVEPLAYYAPSNPLYLLREGRFGNVVRFTRNARLDMSLDGLLAEARILHARHRRPVLIVMSHRLDPNEAPWRVHEQYALTFSADPAQVRRFLAATTRLASLPAARTDESYDIYLISG